MKFAVGGKGGTGKTTFSGTLARAIAQTGHDVVAIDADSNPNLAAMLGISSEDADKIEAIPRNLMERVEEDGKQKLVLTIPAEEVIDQYACRGPDNVRLVIGGRVGHAGAG
ncbi:MAG: AAA family ATPase [Gemmatimonadota bacterium]